MTARHWLLSCLLIAATIASLAFVWLGMDGLVSVDAGRAMRDYAVAFFPPDLSATYLGRVASATLETIAMSVTGTLLAALAGAILALPASGRMGHSARAISRLALNVLRSVPELVWAAIMVFAVGLGPFAGTLALALHTAGVIGRLLAESLENAPEEPAIALRLSGAGAVGAFLYGTAPLVMPQFVAYVLYRWEMNIRMAAILGVVGAGGLGQMLYMSLGLFQQAQAMTVILAMLVLVAAVDAGSAWLRIRMRN